MEALIKELVMPVARSTLHCSTDAGLFNGKLGLIVTYFILSRNIDNAGYAVKAAGMLDALSDNIKGTDNITLHSGLSGVGWAIEWLSSNNFIAVNTNEVLEDIDNFLYKKTLAAGTHLSSDLYIYDIATYFLIRYESTIKEDCRYMSLVHQECLTLLSDLIHAEIGNKHLLSPVRLINLLMFLCVLYKHRINHGTVIYSIQLLAEHCIQILGKRLPISSPEQTDENILVKIACAVIIAGETCKLNCWKKTGSDHLFNLLHRCRKDVTHLLALYHLYCATGDASFNERASVCLSGIDLKKIPVRFHRGMLGLIVCMCGIISNETESYSTLISLSY